MGGSRQRSRAREAKLSETVCALIIIVAGLAAFWLFFFGSEAPPAPTIEDSLKVLLPSTPPQ